MTAACNILTVDDAFFQPLAHLLATTPHARPCPELPDPDFVRLGIYRVLEASPSGRGFLQKHGLRFPNTPSYSNYFATLRSARRGRLLADVHDRLVTFTAGKVSDRLAAVPELAGYECFAP